MISMHMMYGMSDKSGLEVGLEKDVLPEEVNCYNFDPYSG